MIRAREALIQYLRANGMRVTRDRLAILEAVWRLEWHFSQQDLLDELRVMRRGVHRATVYRTLPLLEQAGIIRRTHFRDGAEARYEHHLAHPHHDHLRCLMCDRIIEINRPALEDQQNAVCDEYDFEPVEHRFWVVGYCSECRRKGRRK